jgi:hypothetical protein
MRTFEHLRTLCGRWISQRPQHLSHDMQWGYAMRADVADVVSPSRTRESDFGIKKTRTHACRGVAKRPQRPQRPHDLICSVVRRRRFNG